VAAAVWVASDGGRWLVGPGSAAETAIRLVCIPHAGGGPSFFRPWADGLPGDTELWVAQLPGRESRFREPPAASIAAVAQALAQALAALPPRPCVLFGHSLGALVAYELAHALRARGDLPRLVAVSGRTPPEDRRGPHHLLDLPDDALVDGLAAEYGGISPVLLQSPALRELYAPMLRADLRLVTEYQPQAHPPLPCPLHAFTGDADVHASESAMQGWRRHTSAGFALHVRAGGHFYLADQGPAIVRTLLAVAR
jgi:surfactin synthase thioesterase subunit